MGGLREITAVVVAAECPVGGVVEAIEQVTSHLPTANDPEVCPLCPARPWPCSGFDAAAGHIQAAGIPIGYLVPLDLHARLWPPPQLRPTTPPPGRAQIGEESS
ncbi:hypothetical protein GCM10010174_00180 [Kutzneria viridogrisea]|uniref:Uncharacterized protein n=1 Tax=Kutzneria viridogrisea TaxID=47990 RepID=A0ABR6BD80_9PSEU|nr:hypothetical protein [Kutzneria viridogrisea]